MATRLRVCLRSENGLSLGTAPVQKLSDGHPTIRDLSSDPDLHRTQRHSLYQMGGVLNEPQTDSCRLQRLQKRTPLPVQLRTHLRSPSPFIPSTLWPSSEQNGIMRVLLLPIGSGAGDRTRQIRSRKATRLLLCPKPSLFLHLQPLLH